MSPAAYQLPVLLLGGIARDVLDYIPPDMMMELGGRER